MSDALPTRDDDALAKLEDFLRFQVKAEHYEQGMWTTPRDRPSVWRRGSAAGLFFGGEPHRIVTVKAANMQQAKSRAITQVRGEG